MNKVLTVKQAAKILKVNDSRVRQFILEGRLLATKFANAWMIKEKDLATIKDRKPGRPGKGVYLKARKDRFVISFRDPRDGKKMQRTLPKDTTKMQARQLVRELEKEYLEARLLASKSGDPDRLPLGRHSGRK